MAHHRNPGPDHGRHRLADLKAALQLHRVAARLFQKTAAVGNGLPLIDLVGEKGHVADQQRPLHPVLHRPAWCSISSMVTGTVDS